MKRNSSTAKRRNRGDGSLYLRKDGRREDRYVVGYDDKGLPVTKNVLAKTKSECAAKPAQLRDTLKEPAPDQPNPGILLADGLGRWYQGYKKPNLHPSTQLYLRPKTRQGDAQYSSLPRF